MTTTDPLAGFSTKETHQQHRVPGRHEQVENNAGGFVFEIDPISQFKRFITIGTAGGTYYVGESELTAENGNLVLELTKNEALQIQATDVLVEISEAGRAKKQNQTLFALAIFCQHGTVPAKQHARKQIIKVVRTGTMLFQFIGYLKQFGGWPMGLRREVSAWFKDKDADKLGLQFIKYRQREGWTHRDVLRLSHPKIDEPAKRAAVDWVINGCETSEEGPLPQIIQSFQKAQKPGADIPLLLSENYLPWEALPDSAMNDVEVWNRLIDNGMPIGALLRQLPRLTELGIVSQMPTKISRTDDVIRQLLNEEALQKARIHPFSVLVALKTYAGGHGFRSTWTPVAKIVDALDEMYYRSFKYVEPTGKRTMNALDVSGSMGSQAGNLPLSCREVAAALAMTSVRTEPNSMTVGFTSATGRSQYNGPSDLRELPISARQRLDDVVRFTDSLEFGGTDCSLPMLAAIERNLAIDTFTVYTDNETWAGRMHPFQALQKYRKFSGINSKLIVVSITASKFSIADPKDPGMLDISGFDAAVPTLISDFSAGRV